MNTQTIASILLAITVAVSAQAHPQEAFWVEIPVIDSAADTHDLTGFRSFDLFVRLENGDGVYAQDFGIAGPNDGIHLGAGQDFFQHTFGSDKAANPNLHTIFPDLTYDTRGQMGDKDWGGYNVPIGPINWDPNGVDAGFWGISVGVDTTPALPDENGNYWFARITVSSVGAFGERTSDLGEFLGGQLFLSGEGPNGGFGREIAANGVVDIPNAFAAPSPGAAATMGLLAGGMLIRRRR